MQAGAWDAFDYDPLYAAGKRDYGNGLLVEAYVDGGEISVESLIVDGTTRVLALAPSSETRWTVRNGMTR